MRAARVQQIADDARQAEFVGAQIIEGAEAARQAGIQFALQRPRRLEPGRQSIEEPFVLAEPGGPGAPQVIM